MRASHQACHLYEQRCKIRDREILNLGGKGDDVYYKWPQNQLPHHKLCFSPLDIKMKYEEPSLVKWKPYLCL
jgi:hypothetical protein